MNKIKKINAKIVFVLNEQTSNFCGTYFVIRLKGEDGESYDVVPSSNCKTYNEWKNIAKNIGHRYSGFQFLMEKNGKKFVNKKVLPVNMEQKLF